MIAWLKSFRLFGFAITKYAKWKEQSELFRLFITPMVLVGLLALCVATMPIWSILGSKILFFWMPVDWKTGINSQIGRLGTYGDMFGMVNAVFSGAAFCAIYYTLQIQQKQHDLQLKDLNMRREIAKLEVDKETSKEVIEMSVPYGDKKKGQTRPQCPSNYVRLALQNTKRMPARNCRVMLKSIKKKRPGDESFLVIKESKQSLRLLQYTEDDNASESRTVTIAYDIPHYFNVISVKKEPDRNPYCLVQVAHGQSKYSNIGNNMELNCQYEFCIAVDCDNAKTLEVIMMVSVGATRESLSVSEVMAVHKTAEPEYADAD